MHLPIKYSGQVFTPDYLVKIILDEAGYFGPSILKKHCIENSCGDGAFLIEIIKRYSSEYYKIHHSFEGIQHDISTFIHGIELDPVAYRCCIDNLNALCDELGFHVSQFDISNEDTLMTSRFTGKMDFVVGNPPYVRVHNLNDSYSTVKSFSFASEGLTDLYLVFFEIGFNMLKKGGKLCYITPSSWLNSLAGSKLREHIRQNLDLKSLIDLGHFQAFKATTYTLVSLFTKGERFESFAYHTFDEKTLHKSFVDNLSIQEIDINNYFFLADHNTLATLKPLFTTPVKKYVSVKNGFATLADKIFIRDTFPFSEFLIPVIKASTGKWYQAFFPYTIQGKPLSKEQIFSIESVADYLNRNKTDLLKDADEITRPDWYLFGRTQALKDVAFDKLSINTLIKDTQSIKINSVPKGCGIYSGLYILSDDVDFKIIESILLSSQFIDYIASLKKYKSGGYYTFNSKDLETYINFHLQQRSNETTKIAGHDQ